MAHKETDTDQVINCTPNCTYFPNMDCFEKDWMYDEQQFCKVRRIKKVFKCLYDLQPINWTRLCPYKEDKAKLLQTELEEEKE